MKVRIRVHGHIRSFLPGGKDEFLFVLDAPITLGQLIREYLKVDPMLFASMVVDGCSRRADHCIDRDTEVILLSPAAGG